MSETKHKIELKFDEEVNPEFLADLLDQYQLNREMPDEFGELAVDPVTAFVVIGGAIALGQLVVSVIDKWKGGTVIDMTGERPVIRRDRAVLLGVTVILASDGKVEIKSEDLPKTSLERLVEAVLSIDKDLTVGTIKAAIDTI